MSVCDLEAVVRRCLAAPSLFVVGIDGCGGAGKSHLAGVLAAAIGSRGRLVSIVHGDDFFSASAVRADRATNGDVGGACDWVRLRDQVLVPLRGGHSARYQRYDWNVDALAGWQEVPPRGVVIVEGVYATRIELAAFYDLTLWVECARERRLARGLARDGAGARDTWEKEWMPAEDRYVQAHSPHARADLVWEGEDPR